MVAALPPDVRKGLAFPAATVCVQQRGCASPQAVEAELLLNSRSTLSERRGLSAHQAAEPHSSRLEIISYLWFNPPIKVFVEECGIDPPSHLILTKVFITSPCPIAHPTLSNTAVCGLTSLTENQPSRLPNFFPVQTSVTSLSLGSLNRNDSSLSLQLKRQTICLSGSSTVPTLNESSSNFAATPEGGRSFLNISSRSGGIFVISSPERTIPPEAKIAVA